MKRIILQHWDKEDLPRTVQFSVENMRNYANLLGADHRLVIGFPFDRKLNPPCQKLCMLSEEYDEYDIVVMVDADMFAVKGMTEDVFGLEGVGWHHGTAYHRIRNKRRDLVSSAAPFWGGAIYRLTLEMRQRLREHIDLNHMRDVNSRSLGEDETIMHGLAIKAGVSVTGAYIPYRWCYGSFEPNPELAAIIHLRATVRSRPGFPGDGRDKRANYYVLREKGVIE